MLIEANKEKSQRHGLAMCGSSGLQGVNPTFWNLSTATIEPTTEPEQSTICGEPRFVHHHLGLGSRSFLGFGSTHNAVPGVAGPMYHVPMLWMH